jgi:hypothetical protein
MCTPCSCLLCWLTQQMLAWGTQQTFRRPSLPAQILRPSWPGMACRLPRSPNQPTSNLPESTDNTQNTEKQEARATGACRQLPSAALLAKWHYGGPSTLAFEGKGTFLQLLAASLWAVPQSLGNHTLHIQTDRPDLHRCKAPSLRRSRSESWADIKG